MTQPLQANLVNLAMAPAQAVVDPDMSNFVELAAVRAIVDRCMDNHTVVQHFCEQYRDWITSSKINTVRGLEQFSTLAYSNGTSESFDKFYLQHRSRRFRCFRGEYLYHSLAWHTHGFTWQYLDDAPLAVNDAVVVSLPFADTGEPHNGYSSMLLDRCHELGIPVLIDCAFFGICGSVDFDFDHPAITAVCFSLSKTAPVSLHRIGLRCSRPGFDDSLQVHHRAQYVNKLGAAVGLSILNQLGPDSNFVTWRQRQLDFCIQMRLVPSNTVIFGIDTQHLYDQYNRGSVDTNRICFSKYLHHGKLPAQAQ